MEARDGQAAIAIANSERPDVIFLDIVMPGITAFEVLEQLQHEPKVIFTTAYDQYAVTAFELGALCLRELASDEGSVPHFRAR